MSIGPSVLYIAMALGAVMCAAFWGGLPAFGTVAFSLTAVFIAFAGSEK